MKNLSKRKIVVAMSSGIDSSVAAALLKKAGFEVTGVFMKLADLPRFRESERRAKKVAKILGIPLLVLDLRREFKERVINFFLKEYKLGLTPNPCVVCNKEIKFGLLLEKALSLNADYITTGHYACLKKEKDGTHLLKGKDKEKDQSYFLWQLNQKQLKHILFPIGDYTKTQVRIISKKFKLPILKIPESQEICFVQATINDFLKLHLKEKPGKIISKEGKIIGEHQGLWFYTIGQRKGIGLPGGPAFAKASAGNPYYVLDKDLKKNLLIITKNENDLYRKELIAKNVNWISGKIPKLPLKIRAKIRYRHEPASTVITRSLKSKVSLRFTQPQRAITPGQSVVFYKGQEVLGGGVISESC